MNDILSALESGAVKVNVTALLDEILDLKNKIVKLEIREMEMKKKFLEMNTLLAKDRVAANKIYSEIRKWAHT